MTTHADFEELFRLLEENRVEYLIVGGYAVAYHGYPRFTKDVDIFYSRTEVNVDCLIQALVDFGFPLSALDRQTMLEPGTITTFGVAPLRVDMLNEIDGVTYDAAETGRVRGRYGQQDVWFIGKDALLENKRSTDRLQDKLDVEKLSDG